MSRKSFDVRNIVDRSDCPTKLDGASRMCNIKIARSRCRNVRPNVRIPPILEVPVVRLEDDRSWLNTTYIYIYIYIYIYMSMGRLDPEFSNNIYYTLRVSDSTTGRDSF